MKKTFRIVYRTVTCPVCHARVSFWTEAGLSVELLRTHVGKVHHVVQRASHAPLEAVE